MTSLPSIYKRVGNYNSDGTPSAETSVFCDPGYNGGLPFTVTFVRASNWQWPPPPGLPYLIVRDLLSAAILATVPWTNGAYEGFGAIVNGVLNIFGTQDPQNMAGQNAIIRSTVTPAWVVSAPTTLINSELFGAGIREIGGQVSPNPAGGWSLNYSNQYGVGFLDWPDANFTPGQASASNPNGWTNVSTQGSINLLDQSCGAQWCASDGYWYEVTQLQTSTNSLYWTSMSRSKDRINWIQSSQTLLTPTDMTAIEGINNSDVRMVEHQGSTRIMYLSGDQQTFSFIRQAVFPGTIAQLRAQLFP